MAFFGLEMTSDSVQESSEGREGQIHAGRSGPNGRNLAGLPGIGVDEGGQDRCQESPRSFQRSFGIDRPRGWGLYLLIRLFSAPPLNAPFPRRSGCSCHPHFERKTGRRRDGGAHKEGRHRSWRVPSSLLAVTFDREFGSAGWKKHHPESNLTWHHHVPVLRP